MKNIIHSLMKNIIYSKGDSNTILGNWILGRVLSAGYNYDFHKFDIFINCFVRVLGNFQLLEAQVDGQFTFSLLQIMWIYI